MRFPQAYLAEGAPPHHLPLAPAAPLALVAQHALRAAQAAGGLGDRAPAGWAAALFDLRACRPPADAAP
eukprot:9275853-Pyramimonas_sp.AAC.1